MDPVRRRGDLGGVEELAMSVETRLASGCIKDYRVLLGSASWALTRQVSENLWKRRKTRCGGCAGSCGGGAQMTSGTAVKR